ncbi:MAG: cytidylate kinase-like family protein [candidate division Zixibacteria bacterium]|nr:cytidylate kinase-like family protein [candidate division Zixibacteria bacterium]
MISLESIVDRQIKKWEIEKFKAVKESEIHPALLPVITVSRQQGSRGTYLAKMLAEKLEYEYFHRELIDFICKDAGCRRRLIESLDEKVQPQLQLWLEGIVKGKIVDSSDYMQWLAKSLYTIASHGEAVIIGRGANFILKLNTGLHIRIVAPKSNRISNLIEYKKVTVKDAEQMIEESDKSRREYIRKNFDYDIDDATHYDLIINTAYLDIDTALELSLNALRNKMSNLEKKK